ncbi:hypothetical protein TIFTF001_003006 [Ficus carica]|uniref:At1g68980-like TPR repeats domain-containing protein n=1 Tax=Ficus carica TaxID=3494 RepID=A0AA87ZQI3_FICCA|nr:hypothetical protein TIFTF001_003006 [Ficus carica]
MALLLLKEVMIRPRFVRNVSLGFHVASTVHRTVLKSTYDGNFILIRRFLMMPSVFDVCCLHYQNSSVHFSTDVAPVRLCWEVSSQEVVLKRLETALKCQQVDEAWEYFFDYKKLYGFPEKSLVNRLITELSYSSDPHWVRKGCDLVLLISKEKSGLLQRDVLTKLSLSLARSQLPNPATKILRLMQEKDMLPSMNILLLIVLHMVKTEVGTHLASNFLAQICESFLQIGAKDRNRAELMKPDSTIFNLVLDACVRFKLAFKGQQIMELMPRTGVVADAHSIIIIAQIHEMNGQRDELKKYKAYIDQVSPQFVSHYCQFYDSLLSLHFKFNDIDAAGELIWDICRHREKSEKKNPQKIFLIPIGSYNLKAGLKLQIQPELLQKDTVLKVESKQELATFRDGKLVLSNRALAKLTKGFKRVGSTSRLSKLLVGIQKESCFSRGTNMCSDVVEACIWLGWLEFAHDILDDTEALGALVGRATYMSLLAAYFRRKMLREAKALLKKMREDSMAADLPDKMVVTACLSEMVNDNSLASNESDLVECFIHEMRNEEAVPSVVYKFNSSIYFFCKAKMIEDARRTYRRMQETQIEPTVETFTNLVCGYSSLGMYRDITILWGDMKRNMECGNLSVNRDVYEYLLMSFLRGGYFERVMEVIKYMNKDNMFADKWIYRSEFLKLHKNLYGNLKASEARTKAQTNRLRYVLAFRKWAGID